MKTELKGVIELAIELSQQAEELKPVARLIVDSLKLYEPEVTEILNGVNDFLIDRRAASVKRLEDKHGFTREEAIALTLDVHSRVERRLNNSRNSSSK